MKIKFCFPPNADMEHLTLKLRNTFKQHRKFIKNSELKEKYGA